mmetsp:Transcript_30854/g.55902  ORF Transcript_30854/g.55902 Transcript_30854/m.55902 type:complete len:240 (-) Transcript_30854:205-924(-)
MKKLKIRLFGKLLHLLQCIIISTKPTAKIDDFTQQSEMRFVRHQPKHNEICILSIHAVTCIRLIPGLIPHIPNMLHNLMLSLARQFRAGENDAQIPPQGILLDLFTNEIADAIGDTEQELRAGGDAVGVECPRVGIDGIGVGAVEGYDAFVFCGLGQIFGGSESTGTLLVKFCTWCNSIDGHVDGNFWLDDLCNNAIEVMHNPKNHITFSEDIGHIEMIGVGASMDNSIHIQVQMIKLG